MKIAELLTALGIGAPIIFACGFSLGARFGHTPRGSSEPDDGLTDEAKISRVVYTNPGPYPHEQRSWADLFAACRFNDAWLGSDVDGNPTCYPLGQRAASVP